MPSEEEERDKLWAELQDELMAAFVEAVEDAFTCGHTKAGD